MKLCLFPCGLAAGMVLLLSSFDSVRHQPFPQPLSKEQSVCAAPSFPATPFTCAQPTGLVSYINPPDYDYTLLQWNAVSGAVSYTYELYYSHFTPGSFMFLIEEGEFSTIAYPIAAYTDLPGYYDWRVNTNCSGSSSAWSYGSFYLPN